jgi:hypothetical protein
MNNAKRQKEKRDRRVSKQTGTKRLTMIPFLNGSGALGTNREKQEEARSSSGLPLAFSNGTTQITGDVV